MSNDLLPLPDILAEPPKATGHAGTATDVVALERNGHFLTEHPSRNSHSDTPGFIRTIGHLEAVTPNDSPTQVRTPLADGLADVAVTVRQIESILQANGTLALEVHFAVERIHDVAMALRMREVDAALCDTLEASIREVGDAIVRNDAAAARSLSAVALLCDLSRRIDQMIPRAPVAAPEPESAERPAGVATSDDDIPGSNGVSAPPMACAVGVVVSDDDDHARSLLQPAFVRPALPEMQASAETREDAAELAKPVALWVPSPVAESKEVPQPNNQEAETAREPIAIETVGSEFAESRTAQASPPSVEMNAAAPANSCVAPNDPLAPLYSLSEEELIALFS
jgi:hypothetical protein